MTNSQSTSIQSVPRRYPIGVERIRRNDGSIHTHARVWAPAAQSVELVIDDDSAAGSASLLAAEGGGYHSAYVERAEAGA